LEGTRGLSGSFLGALDFIKHEKCTLHPVQMVIHEIVESESAKKVVVYVGFYQIHDGLFLTQYFSLQTRAQGKAHTDHPFAMEFMLTFSFRIDSGGELKSAGYKAFTDPLHFQEFFGADAGSAFQADTE
jgi:hypothetical protein